MAKKAPTAAERRYMGRVAGLGCAVCRRLGLGETPALIHHPRAGIGKGMKCSNYDTIPLCLEHHVGETGVHTLGLKGLFFEMYGFTEQDLQIDTKQLLNGV